MDRESVYLIAALRETVKIIPKAELGHTSDIAMGRYAQDRRQKR